MLEAWPPATTINFSIPQLVNASSRSLSIPQQWPAVERLSLLANFPCPVLDLLLTGNHLCE